MEKTTVTIEVTPGSDFIEVTPGSDFQRETMLGALRVFLKGWASFYRLRHRNNKITISFDE